MKIKKEIQPTQRRQERAITFLTQEEMQRLFSVIILLVPTEADRRGNVE